MCSYNYKDPKGKRKSSLQAEFDNTGSCTPMASLFATSVLDISQLLNRSPNHNAKMKKKCDKVLFFILDFGHSEVLQRESFEFFREKASTYRGSSNIILKENNVGTPMTPFGIHTEHSVKRKKNCDDVVFPVIYSSHGQKLRKESFDFFGDCVTKSLVSSSIT
ncbi:hypothetical protein SLA2020_433120 [Shorea laevis]